MPLLTTFLWIPILHRIFVYGQNLTIPLICGKSGWICLRKPQCIPLSSRCDGQIDCEDGTDEICIQSIEVANSTLKEILIYSREIQSFVPVCWLGLDITSAHLLCQQMGYPTISQIRPLSLLESDSFKTSHFLQSIKGIQCSGTESSIQNCKINHAKTYCAQITMISCGACFQTYYIPEKKARWGSNMSRSDFARIFSNTIRINSPGYPKLLANLYCRWVIKIHPRFLAFQKFRIKEQSAAKWWLQAKILALDLDRPTEVECENGYLRIHMARGVEAFPVIDPSLNVVAEMCGSLDDEYPPGEFQEDYISMSQYMIITFYSGRKTKSNINSNKGFALDVNLVKAGTPALTDIIKENLKWIISLIALSALIILLIIYIIIKKYKLCQKKKMFHKKLRRVKQLSMVENRLWNEIRSRLTVLPNDKDKNDNSKNSIPHLKANGAKIGLEDLSDNISCPGEITNRTTQEYIKYYDNYQANIEAGRQRTSLNNYGQNESSKNVCSKWEHLYSPNYMTSNKSTKSSTHNPSNLIRSISQASIKQFRILDKHFGNVSLNASRAKSQIYHRNIEAAEKAREERKKRISLPIVDEVPKNIVPIITEEICNHASLNDSNTYTNYDELYDQIPDFNKAPITAAVSNETESPHSFPSFTNASYDKQMLDKYQNVVKDLLDKSLKNSPLTRY